MVKLIKQNGQTSYGITEYVVDTFAELNNLFDGNMGDTAYVINEKQTYILNSEKQWIIKKINSSGTGKDGLTPYINDNGTWQIGDVDTGVKAEGADGSKGDQGEKGEDGVGIDEIYIQDGNLYVKKTTDPEAISLGSVKGDKGNQGPQGPQGDKGEPGASGVDGKSAYEIAVDKGFEGNEEEWLDSLKNATDLTDYATTDYVDSTVGDIQKTLSLMVGGV